MHPAQARMTHASIIRSEAATRESRHWRRTACSASRNTAAAHGLSSLFIANRAELWISAIPSVDKLLSEPFTTRRPLWSFGSKRQKGELFSSPRAQCIYFVLYLCAGAEVVVPASTECCCVDCRIIRIVKVSEVSIKIAAAHAVALVKTVDAERGPKAVCEP